MALAVPIGRWRESRTRGALTCPAPAAASTMAITSPARAEPLPPASARPGGRLAGVGVESWVLGLLISAACWLFAPKQSDLAAAAFRRGLFEHHGLLMYNAQWYGRHHPLRHPLLSPPRRAWAPRCPRRRSARGSGRCCSAPSARRSR